MWTMCDRCHIPFQTRKDKIFEYKHCFCKKCERDEMNIKLVTADTLNYQICPNCSHDNCWIYHPDGKCPKNKHECLICKDAVGDLNGVRLGYGSQYDDEYICYKCLDKLIALAERIGS